ncbi:MAG TPA: phosphoribosylanthranilate isomerase [Alphaproteobacteria bacterium]|nr:phosphoribosylanthranilate isomerase [Alphaproteobacteria bacterium]
MTIAVKICGVNDRVAAKAAAEGGAAFVGLVFYPPSPRFVKPRQAADIVSVLPAGIERVGLFVDAGEGAIEDVLSKVRLDMLQLHGDESPDDVVALKARFDLPIMKAIKIAAAEDLTQGERYAAVADWLLFDAKPPKAMTSALPGGNALRFDWELLAGRKWPKPWMLSGGLREENLEEAVRITGATVIDVSSGVEISPGHKDPARIRAFIATAKRL